MRTNRLSLIFRSLTVRSLKEYSSIQNQGANKSLIQAKERSKKSQTSLKEWYNISHNYWKNAQANDNGMLMGRVDLHSTDIQFSTSFFDKFASNTKFSNFSSALDCGAGIGRISEYLLRNRFLQIDMVQKCQHFVQKAKQNQVKTNYRRYYCCGLQQFTFQQQYNCIWIQWVLTHLPDTHAIQFLKKAKRNLEVNGVIVIKQNYTKDEKLIDKEDSTITRTLTQWKALFYDAKFLILRQQQQPDWPSDLYPVKMWILG